MRPCHWSLKLRVQEAVGAAYDWSSGPRGAVLNNHFRTSFPLERILPSPFRSLFEPQTCTDSDRSSQVCTEPSVFEKPGSSVAVRGEERGGEIQRPSRPGVALSSAEAGLAESHRGAGSAALSYTYCRFSASNRADAVRKGRKVHGRRHRPSLGRSLWVPRRAVSAGSFAAKSA